VKELRAVRLAFRTVELAPHVYFCDMKIEVSSFVAAVNNVTNVGNFVTEGTTLLLMRRSKI
jgi:hypothetical protein